MRRDPTEFRERFKRWKAGEKVYDAGTPTMPELQKYNEWVDNLPKNLQNSPNYDLYGAWKSGATPELQDDGFYHLPTRDPNTGLILKGDFHPTLLEGLAFDIDAGYYPKRENGRYYTRSWQDFKTVPEYDGGKTPKVNSQEGQQYLLSYKDGNQTKILGRNIEECAEFANAVMNHFGYNVSGDAWHPNQMSLLYSGYDTSNFPSEYNEQAVDLYNKQASDNFYKNFDSKTMLDPKQIYRVNMRYQGSPNKEKAYNGNRGGVTGTHTGVVFFDQGSKRWKVLHNKSGTIHVSDFTKTQNSNDPISITAIYEPRANNAINNAVGGLIRLFGGNYNFGKSPKIIHCV